MVRQPAPRGAREVRLSRWVNLLCVFAVVALAVIVAACNSSPTSTASNSPKPSIAIATVNGRSISSKIFDVYLENGREGLGLDPNTPDGRAKLDRLREGIVSELIDRTLIAQEAERRQLSIAPARLSQAEKQAVQELGGEAKYEAFLKAHNLTREEYGDVIKAELYGELLRADFSRDISIPDDEIRKYYDAHKRDPDLQQPERVTASHILVAARPNVISQEIQRDQNISGSALSAATEKEMAKRKQRAEVLLREAVKSKDFAGIARQNSDDSATRDRGGDLGTFTRDTHTRPFDDAAFSLKPGLSGATVVQTEFGFHVLMVSAHEPARTLSLGEASKEIRDRLQAAREASRLSEWLAEERRKAEIQIEPTYRFGALKTEFPN